MVYCRSFRLWLTFAITLMSGALIAKVCFANQSQVIATTKDTYQKHLRKPKRVVSLNVCTDQLLLLLAQRKNIASVTFLGADPEVSVFAEKAKGIYLNKGHAEEVLALNPDLIFASNHTFRPTLELLRELGKNVIELRTAKTINEVKQQIEVVANVLGEKKLGARVLNLFDSRIKKLKSNKPRFAPKAMVYHANGYTSGKGTLINEVLELGGFSNLSSRLGIKKYGYLPLELLMRSKPEYLVLEVAYGRTPAIAFEIFKHPALVNGLRFIKTISIPTSFWSCPGPALLDAAEILSTARQK